MKIRCSQGEHDVNVGDHVDMAHQGKWEVVRFGPERMYGPESLGGTPVVICKPLGEVARGLTQYLNKDGTLDFCGDSIASAMIDTDRRSQTVGEQRG